MSKRITYKTSGVDVKKANAFVRSIQGYMSGLSSSSVIVRNGSFGGLFALNDKKFKNPVLVSSSDGVGTKLLIAQRIGKHDTIGIDLVAMNINDILCVGAKPLFFLDYIACGKLDPKVLKEVMKGIALGCRQSDCSLLGGETAEMPGMYKQGEYDLAGFAVGVVEKSKIIDGSGIKAGDRILGLPSSGLHSNGFSLVRKIFSSREQRKLAKELLKPTKIYAKQTSALVKKFKVKGIAHITGGAFYEKLTKILPQGKCFVIDKSWPIPKIFQIIQKKGKINNKEMYRTFNMGIGLALVFKREDMPAVKTFLKRQKIKYYDIGTVMNDPKRKIVL